MFNVSSTPTAVGPQVPLQDQVSADDMKAHNFLLLSANYAANALTGTAVCKQPRLKAHAPMVKAMLDAALLDLLTWFRSADPAAVLADDELEHLARMDPALTELFRQLSPGETELVYAALGDGQDLWKWLQSMATPAMAPHIHSNKSPLNHAFHVRALHWLNQLRRDTGRDFRPPAAAAPVPLPRRMAARRAPLPRGPLDETPVLRTATQNAAPADTGRDFRPTAAAAPVPLPRRMAARRAPLPKGPLDETPVLRTATQNAAAVNTGRDFRPSAAAAPVPLPRRMAARRAPLPRGPLDEAPVLRTAQQNAAPAGKAAPLRASFLLREAADAMRRDGNWNSLAGEIAPYVLNTLPGWPPGRALEIQTSEGHQLLQLDAVGGSGGAPVQVVLDTRRQHYSALVNGRRVEVPADGNCFYNAALVALGETDRRRLLASLGVNDDAPFSKKAVQALRQGMAHQLSTHTARFEPMLALLDLVRTRPPERR